MNEYKFIIEVEACRGIDANVVGEAATVKEAKRIASKYIHEHLPERTYIVSTDHRVGIVCTRDWSPNKLGHWQWLTPMYPRLIERGWPVTVVGNDRSLIVESRYIQLLVGDERTLFNEYFGCQTMVAGGPFAWDVEDVLERMASGRRQGTQSVEGWD